MVPFMGSAADIPRDAPGAQPPDGPWNPGLRLPIPGEILPLATLHLPENVFACLDVVEELVDFTGSSAVRVCPHAAMRSTLARSTLVRPSIAWKHQSDRRQGVLARRPL